MKWLFKCAPKTEIKVNNHDCKDCIYYRPLAGVQYKCMKLKKKNYLYDYLECPLNGIPLIKEKWR